MAWYTLGLKRPSTEQRAVSFVDPNGVSIPSPVHAGGYRGATAHLDALGAKSFRTSAVFQRAEQLVVDQLATRPLRILGPDGKPLPNHPLLTLWNKTPNLHQSSFAFHTMRLKRKERYGQVHIILDRGGKPTGPVRSMSIVTGPIRMLLNKADVANPYGSLAGWQVQIGNDWVRYLPEEMLWDRYPDPDDTWGAVSPIAAVLTAVGMGEAARQWQANLLTAGGAPSVIVMLEGADASAARAASASLRDTWQGPGNAGKIGVFGTPVGPDGKPMGATITPVSFNSQQSMFLDTIKLSTEEIAQAMGVPIDLINGNRNSFESLATADTQLWSHTLLTKLRSSASEIDRLLLPDPQITAEYDVDDVDALKENEDARYTRWLNVLKGNGCTIDEFRAQVGLDALPNGDVLLAEFQQGLNTQQALALASSNPAAPAARIAIDVTGSRVSSDTERTETRKANAVVTPAEKIKRMYDDGEADGLLVVRSLADYMAKHVTRNLNNKRAKAGTGVRVDLSQVFNTAAITERSIEMLTPWLTTYYRNSGRVTAKGLGVDFDNQVSQAVLDAVTERARVSAESIVGTTADELAAALAAGVTAGEGTDALARRLTAVFDTLSTTRATTIARTEVVAGHNVAARTVAIQSGIVGLRRRWMATGGVNGRPSHTRMDGHTTEGLYDRYPNGLLHPGDGGADESANCRCVEEFLPPDAA